MNLKDCDTCIYSRPVHSENGIRYICSKHWNHLICMMHGFHYYKQNPLRIISSERKATKWNNG